MLDIGRWLKDCRKSLNMSQHDLATCVHKEDRFPLPPEPEVEVGMIQDEIAHIERYDDWTFAGQVLSTFWQNVFICLKRADPWALRLLTLAVLSDFP